MPDFAPNFTARYRAKYKVAGLVHTIQFRFARGLSGGAIVTGGHGHANALFAALAAGLADDFTWIQSDWCQEDSTIFTPAGSTPASVTGLTPIASFSKSAKITALHFPGKSTVSKVGCFVYGWLAPTATPGDDTEDLIVFAAENSAIAAAIATLPAGTALVAANNVTASWYSYATVKTNDFHGRQLRKSAF
jgi:hypothetical protein